MSYRGFVLFAEMRTGSNHLEESLNALTGVESFGEIFNPVFLGAHNRTELMGIDMAARDADPVPLLDAVLDAPGITGFRFFHDHDPRILDRVLADRTVAKVILSRNPVDSYVSLGIASRTGQWRLFNPKMAKEAKARFDGAAFDAGLERATAFRARVHGALQRSGQAPFLIDYADIGDVDVVNGIAAFLGTEDRLDALPGRLKRQNPGAAVDKVENPEALRAHLEGLDPFALHALPGMEPPRGPRVPRTVVGARTPLMMIPIPGGPTAAVSGWLAARDGAAPRTGLTQKDLRPWMQDNPGFHAVSVLRHPLARAWEVMVGAVMPAQGGPLAAARALAARHHGVDWPDDAGDAAAMATAFKGWLRFLRDNLGGRSAAPIHDAWASQAATVAGMAAFVPPHRLIPERDLAATLGALVGEAAPTLAAPDWPLPLEAVADDEAAALCHDAYRRDYLVFGFAMRP